MPTETESTESSSSPRKMQSCFVVSPIGNADSEQRTHADWVYFGIIAPVMSEFPSFETKRADHDTRPGLIDVQLIHDLFDADLVIADLSFYNPNVFYEIGIRHMVQKPIIHMHLSPDKPPFDVSLYRAISFSRTRFSDIETAKNDLRKFVSAVQRSDYQVENPITNARGRIQLSNNASSADSIILSELENIKNRLSVIEAEEGRAEIAEQINSQIISNSGGKITPDILRNILLAMLKLNT
jgi:hypothetical protein